MIVHVVGKELISSLKKIPKKYMKINSNLNIEQNEILILNKIDSLI